MNKVLNIKQPSKKDKNLKKDPALSSMAEEAFIRMGLNSMKLHGRAKILIHLMN
jgi:hypothetical protein